MSNPLQRLKQLPWIPLFLIAILTTFWAFVLEFFLLVGSMYLPVISNALTILFSSPMDLVMGLAVGAGVGALAVYLLDAVYPQLTIDLSTLWALLFCLMLAVLVRSLMPAVPPILVTPSTTLLLGMLLGIFWKGKPYWR